MSDYTEHGSVPVEDAAVDDPPTVEAVAAKQRRDFPTRVVEKGQVVDDVTDTAFEHRSFQPTVSFESARVTCSDVLIVLANALFRPDRVVRKATSRRLIEAGLEASTEFSSRCASLSDEGWLREAAIACETCADHLRGLLRRYATLGTDAPDSAISHQ